MLRGGSPEFFKIAIDHLAETLADNRVVILKDQQHIAMDTAPDLFAQILTFLK